MLYSEMWHKKKFKGVLSLSQVITMDKVNYSRAVGVLRMYDGVDEE